MKEVGKVFGLGGGGGDAGFAAAQAQQAAIIAKQEAQATEERSRLQAEQMARQRAARRSGMRALLSDARLTPESGLPTTLGASL
jgi:hypothetical protein